jgi:hypothetical protein
MATNPQQMQAQAEMARMQQGAAQPYMSSPTPSGGGGGAGRGTSNMAMKKGGKVKKMAKGGSASSRADGIATKGKTRGKMC